MLLFIIESTGWLGRTPNQMLDDTESDAKTAFLVFCGFANRRLSESATIADWFPGPSQDYSKLVTGEAWEAYFKKMQWIGRSPAAMCRDVASGASAAFGAFKRWVSGDHEARSEISARLFPVRKHSEEKHASMKRDGFNSVEEWREHFRSKGWFGRTSGALNADPDREAYRTYLAFVRWTRRQSDETREKISEFFPSLWPKLKR